MDQEKNYIQRLTTGRTLNVLPVTRDVLMKAAQLRAANPSLKLPDAIHAATALQHGCTTFVTNDSRFTALAELPVLLLSQWNAG
jgi:predicted nucleic acid-binding protein